MTAHWREDVKPSVQDEQTAPGSAVMSTTGHRMDEAGWVGRGFSDC